MTTAVHPGLDETLLIPPKTGDLAGFRCWTHSPSFPEAGRIDFLAGSIEVTMSPEDLYTHGTPKTALAVGLATWIEEKELGAVFIDRTRIVSVEGDLSAEPDVVAVLWSSFDSGRAREVPSASREPGRYVEIEGAPDLVVEVVSNASVAKDLERLPRLYARAGIPELWILDARGEIVDFQVRSLRQAAYVTQIPDVDGWSVSSLLGCRVRVIRRQPSPGRWTYRLERAP